MDVDSPNSLKRCSSAPQINNLLPTAAVGINHHHMHQPQQQQQQSSVVPMDEGQSQPTSEPTGSSAGNCTTMQQHQSTINHNQSHQRPASLVTNSSASVPGAAGCGMGNSLTLGTHGQNQRSHSPHNLHTMSSSSTSSLLTAGSHSGAHRDPPPTSFSNIFAQRPRRFSASFSPLAVISNGSSSPNRSGSCNPGPRLTPRISQLRQEESADVSNSREVNHEREIHSAMQMSQSYEDLTLVTENWSFGSGSGGNNKNNDDLANPLHVALPSVGTTYCSSPSPTSRGGLGLQYPTSSPSPTRKYVTRRSMSPCTIRPSPLSSSVKRKFDLDDHHGSSCYSPPPLKKIFNPERGSSPVCQTPSPSPICPSPDSSTASFENGSNNASSSGRITPKFFVTKLSSASSNGNSILHGGPPVGLTCSLAHPLHNDSPPLSTSSSSSLMMMDCGVSSSSGHHALLEEDSSMAGKGRGGQDASIVGSSSAGAKIDCDEDITDLNVIASSTSAASMVTTESSEAMMEEVVIKASRSATLSNDSHCQTESELLDSSSSGLGQSHSRLSTGSISNASSTDINSESSSSLCPIAFSAGGGGSGGPAAVTFLANNIEIAET